MNRRVKHLKELLSQSFEGMNYMKRVKLICRDDIALLRTFIEEMFKYVLGNSLSK